MDIIPVILCGGSGTRLWPLSRRDFPKQCHALLGEQTLFQQTLLRARMVSPQPPVIVTAPDYRFMLQDQAQAVDVSLGAVILEPEPKNTAPAIALAALSIAEKDPEAVMFVMSADHHFDDTTVFQDMADTLSALPLQSHLLTFGIAPRSPSTAYGYVQSGELAVGQARNVQQFVEKPSVDKAQAYLDSGDYWWNSGMFAFSVGCYLEALAKHQPEMYQRCQTAWSKRALQYGCVILPEHALADCPSDSIDYAVMEHATALLVLPLTVGWSDVGSWSVLHDLLPADAQNNVLVGDAQVHDSQNNLVIAKNRLVTLAGVHDHVVVETTDSVLVMPKAQDQQVKQVVQHLLDHQREEAISHPLVHRPWGHFETLIELPGYKVKRIHVKPGAKLSLQRHQQRSEHWVVVKGEAKVRVGDAISCLHAGASVDIPVMALHQLSNEGADMVEIIEVQLGAYLGEDDIERLEDQYGRCDQVC